MDEALDELPLDTLLQRYEAEPDPERATRLAAAARRRAGFLDRWVRWDTLALPEELDATQRRVAEVFARRSDARFGGFGLPATPRRLRQWLGLDAPSVLDRRVPHTSDGESVSWPLRKVLAEADDADLEHGQGVPRALRRAAHARGAHRLRGRGDAGGALGRVGDGGPRPRRARRPRRRGRGLGGGLKSPAQRESPDRSATKPPRRSSASAARAASSTWSSRVMRASTSVAYARVHGTPRAGSRTEGGRHASTRHRPAVVTRPSTRTASSSARSPRASASKSRSASRKARGGPSGRARVARKRPRAAVGEGGSQVSGASGRRTT